MLTGMHAYYQVGLVSGWACHRWQDKEHAHLALWTLLGPRLCNVMICMKPNVSKYILSLIFVEDYKNWHCERNILKDSPFSLVDQVQ